MDEVGFDGVGGWWLGVVGPAEEGGNRSPENGCSVHIWVWIGGCEASELDLCGDMETMILYHPTIYLLFYFSNHLNLPILTNLS